MKYKLINRTTKEETLCDKVTIDGFDYYVGNEKSDFVYIPKDGALMEQVVKYDTEEYRLGVRIFGNKNHKYVIATNNSTIDIPQVVDEAERLAHKDNPLQKLDGEFLRASFKRGYNKSQETHPFSEEDVIEFNVWQKSLLGSKNDNWLVEKSDKELLQIWKEQQPKIIYFE